MTPDSARELQTVLSQRVPDGMVTVIACPGGAKVVITSGGLHRTYRIGDGPSPILNMLLTGYAN